MRVLEALTKLVVGMSKFGDHLLSRKVSGAIVAALAFACGAGLFQVLKREPPPKQVAPADCSPPAAYSAPPVVEDTLADEYALGDSAELQEWKNLHGGTPLPLDYERASEWGGLSRSKVVVLPNGRTLAAAGDALYLLGTNKRTVWRHEVPQVVIDFAYIEATGMVYVTGGDNIMSILDAATGRELAQESRNGSAGFGAVIPYGDDACLVMDSFGGYRAHLGAANPMQDGATAWQGTRMLWHVETPPDAELQVVGSKIYAVTKTRTRILVKEIKVPKR